MIVQIDLQSEIADNITASALKEQYDQIVSDIDEVTQSNKPQGIYSWESVEAELRELNKAKEHFEYVLEYMAGDSWKDD